MHVYWLTSTLYPAIRHVNVCSEQECYQSKQFAYAALTERRCLHRILYSNLLEHIDVALSQCQYSADQICLGEPLSVQQTQPHAGASP
jgi:hypothetical protein